MQRFRLLGLYLLGVASVVGLAVWGVSLRRVAAGTSPPSGAGASQGSPTAATTGAAAKVSIDNFAFSPKELVVTTGVIVTWVNTDDVAHTVTSNSVPPIFDSKTLHTEDKFSFEFKRPGTYEYFCKPHPYMTGKVIVK
ncbi:MAG TPA: plastocyanin/azurin family copper-binding protein [Gemmataceae bacterium]|nr:plastocyanin/azurin family copper-binding protein [Gemmataceae bacterium]